MGYIEKEGAMKTTASSIELVSSRVRILLLVSFTCLVMAAWFGMTTGCGGGGGAATPDEPGDTPISAVPGSASRTAPS